MQSVASRASFTAVGQLFNQALKRSNIVVITGPVGCGKTAAVYACAESAGYHVHEVNAGSMRRSGKALTELFGEISKSHRVTNEVCSGRSSSFDSANILPPPSTVTATTTASVTTTTATTSESVDSSATLSTPAQVLILIEDADIWFDEDRGAWTALQSLAESSRRPIVLVCNNITLLPRDVINPRRVLFFE
ncbi:hypothetical protein GQ42DRAFT_125630, partial [Ramicandelaber brevisporus]